VASAQERVILQQAQAQAQLQNSIRATLLQGLAGLLVVAGAVATWRHVQISREGQITDRLSHAIDQVGDDKVDIRVGGIYALERLAKDGMAHGLQPLSTFRGLAAQPAGGPRETTASPQPWWWQCSGGGTSRAGLPSKKPSARSWNPTRVTGITGQSSGRTTW
jgi:hypothetical protein